MKRYELVRWAKTEESRGAYTDVDSTKHWSIRDAERALRRLRYGYPDSAFGLVDRWLGCEVYNWVSIDDGKPRRWGGWLRLRGAEW